mmetsp:Transcript_21949/g.69749  ORF Transcript_21949/g.69749 Transcript_21949/m.69749 type:complete len:382 (-) Transcript_21949:171-1316(-)
MASSSTCCRTPPRPRSSESSGSTRSRACIRCTPSSPSSPASTCCRSRSCRSPPAPPTQQRRQTPRRPQRRGCSRDSPTGTRSGLCGSSGACSRWPTTPASSRRTSRPSTRCCGCCGHTFRPPRLASARAALQARRSKSPPVEAARGCRTRTRSSTPTSSKVCSCGGAVLGLAPRSAEIPPRSRRGVLRRRRAVLSQLPRMWALAEKDLLGGGYRLRDTGQGRHRVQSAPNVGQLMSEVLRRLQAEQGGGWVGSSAVHLGDDDVPNALVWVDKYSQVPRILGPIAHAVSQSTLDLLAAKPGVSGYIVSAFGSAEACRLAVLADFFKHGFDGSGADNFYDAGSCIDGRLTSAWHFCAQLSKKPYYPLFQMSGFVGFDGAFGRR